MLKPPLTAVNEAAPSTSRAALLAIGPRVATVSEPAVWPLMSSALLSAMLTLPATTLIVLKSLVLRLMVTSPVPTLMVVRSWATTLPNRLTISRGWLEVIVMLPLMVVPPRSMRPLAAEPLLPWWAMT